MQVVTRSCALTLLLAAAAAIVGPAAATSPTIHLEELLALGGKSEGEGLICRGFPAFAADPGRGFYVAPGCDPGTFLAFDPAGGFRGVVGSTGQGPGELTGVNRLHLLPTGEVIAVNFNRVVVFGPDHEYRRGYENPFMPFDLVNGGGGTTIQNSVSTAEHVIHVVGPNGELLRSFGDVAVTDTEDRRVRWLEESSTGGVWAAHFIKYWIDEWDPETGELLRSFEPERDFFRPWTEGSDLQEEALVSGLYDSGDGLLWVHLSVPDPDFHPETAAQRGVPDGALTNAHERRDSILEALDSRDGRLVASARFDAALGAFENGYLWTFIEDEDGDAFIQLWRVSVDGWPGRS